MPTLPVDIVNRALDECGLDEIGDLREGSDSAKAAIRVYEPLLRQMLSAAHWNFARKQERLELIADVSGQLIANTSVPGPWGYAYDWPIDCVHARFVPRTYMTSTVNLSGPVTAQGTVAAGGIAWSSPAPFIVASFPLPNPIGSEWGQTEGHDPEQTRVILTNQCGASLVYTGMMQYPDAWDPLFEQAMVAVLAARLAMPLIEDKKFAREVRSDNIAIAKASIDTARVRDGDEGWTVQNHTPDWMRARTSSAGWYGPGILYNSWDSMPFVEDAGGAY
jgi:hypothetical protein